jgi:hypothetical protein
MERPYYRNGWRQKRLQQNRVPSPISGSVIFVLVIRLDTTRARYAWTALGSPICLLHYLWITNVRLFSSHPWEAAQTWNSTPNTSPNADALGHYNLPPDGRQTNAWIQWKDIMQIRLVRMGRWNVGGVYDGGHVLTSSGALQFHQDSHQVPKSNVVTSFCIQTVRRLPTVSSM